MGWLWKRGETKEHTYAAAQLSAYLDDELSPQERERVERHLSVCADCRWNLDTLRQTVQWTRQLPTVPVPRVFTLPASVQPARRERRRGWAPVLQGATALVALLLVLVVAGDLMWPGPMTQMAPMPQAVEREAPSEKAVGVGDVEATALPAAESLMVEQEEVTPIPTAPPESPPVVLEVPPADESEEGSAGSLPEARSWAAPPPTPVPLSTPTPSLAQKPEAEDRNVVQGEAEPLAAAPAAAYPLRLVELGLGLIFLLLATLTVMVTLRQRRNRR